MSPTYSINSILAEDTMKDCPSRKRRLVAFVRAIFEGKANTDRGEKCRGDLGMEEWDGFTWAEQRHCDGKRVERAWDGLKREWTVVQRCDLERSASPCEVRWVIKAQGEQGVKEGVKMKQVSEEKNRDGWHGHESFQTGGVTTEYQGETSHAEKLMSEHSQRMTNAGSRHMFAASCNQESPVQNGGLESDNNAIVHPSGTFYEILPEKTRSSDLVIKESKEVRPGPDIKATKEYFSVESLGVWKATVSLAATKPWKRIVPWKLGSSGRLRHADSCSEIREAHLASPGAQDLPADSSRSELDGLAKLIESIDSMRVNRVRHIWHAETGHWTHERTEKTENELNFGDVFGGQS